MDPAVTIALTIISAVVTAERKFFTLVNAS
jgi:hypothetical protein